MVESFEKFPPTGAGKKMAMAFADAERNVWWEEYVDWDAAKDEVFGEFDELQVLTALRRTVVECPQLFSSEERVQINQTLIEFGLEGVFFTPVPYAGTEADIRILVRQPSAQPHPYSREALPG